MFSALKRSLWREYFVIPGLSSESGQATVRIFATLALAAYLTIFSSELYKTGTFKAVLALVALQTLFAVTAYYWATTEPTNAPIRRGVVAVVDQVLLGCLLLKIGQLAAPLSLMPLLLVLGSGLRFGRIYGRISWIVAMLFLVGSAIWHKDSPNSAALSANVALAICLFPFYIFRLTDPLAVAGRLDSLTRLKNRQVFDDLNKDLCARAASSDSNGAVVLIDLDGFKQINDQQGHPVGDEVLVMVAQLLYFELLPLGTPCRTGGDEFGVIVDKLSSEQTLEDALHRLLSHLQDASHTFNSPLGASIGIFYVHSGITLTPKYTYDAADSLMFDAKKRGKGNIQTSRERQFSKVGKVLPVAN